MTVSSIRLAAAILLAAAVYLPAAAQATVGLTLHEDAAYDGYTLFAPIPSMDTYLINNEGKLVRSWTSRFRPGLSVYLTDAGTLLRTGQYAPGGSSRFNAGGQGGRVEEFAWDGTLLWDYIYSDTQHRQHHDIERLPNGNVLLIAWEYKSQAEAIAAGRDPSRILDGELWPDHIVEIEPDGATGGTIVWEWHVWDHLIQDHDASKDNYGVVADHPELVDLNYNVNPGPNGGKADWNHTNGIDYNAALDQIVLSVHGFNEIWIIDHSTTTAEAAGHSGGNSGRGGDLLYRWGNPEAYDRGTVDDRTLFRQHDARWIEAGFPGEHHILIFNNGRDRPEGDHSSVDEIATPVDEFGDYFLEPGSTYGPAATVWSWAADPPESFYAASTSGAHRLPNGNTLISHGPQGTFLEVTPAKNAVWRYVNPVSDSGILDQGEPGLFNGVFRAHRYEPGHPAFDGRDLTPGDPIESFTPPTPVPDGAGTTAPMTAARVNAAGDWIEVDWDATSCMATGYNLLFGSLDGLSTYTLTGAECGIPTTGSHDWLNVPAGDLFFVLAGVDSTGVYESSWGLDGTGAERGGSAASWMCGVTTRVTTDSCP